MYFQLHIWVISKVRFVKETCELAQLGNFHFLGKQTLLDPPFANMNKLIFVGQFFKSNFDFFYFRCKLPFRDNCLTVSEKNLWVFLPFGYHCFYCIAQGDLQLSMLVEALGQSSVVILEESDHVCHYSCFVFLVLDQFDNFVCFINYVPIVFLLYFA